MAKGQYRECPNCSNVAPGTQVIRCDSCKSLHCEACERKGVFGVAMCPECGAERRWSTSREFTVLGHIS